MAEVNTSTTNFAGLLTTLVSREVQTVLRDDLRWMQEGAYKKGTIIPGTNQIRYAAYGDLTVDASAVAVEGVANDPVGLAIGYETFGASQKMRTVRITDVALDMSPHDLYMIAAEKIAHNAAAVADFTAYTAIMASTLNTYWPNKRANRAALTTGDNLTAAVVRDVVRKMKKSNIPPFADGYYRAMIDPNVVYDLQSDTSVGGWIEASKYAAPGQLLNGEIGRIGGVRFIETNLGLEVDSTGGVADAFNIYSTIFFGPEYFAFGDLQSIKSYMVPPGGDHDDPAAQAALVSWKGMYGVHVMGDDTDDMATVGAGPRFVNLEHIGSVDF